jgi:pentapeptide MXKDX repeat protein
MRTIFHAAMFGGLIVACSVGLIGCGSSSASPNKMSNQGTTGEKMSGEKMGGNMMSNDKMSGDKMAMDKMSGDKMNGKMAKAQTP